MRLLLTTTEQKADSQSPFNAKAESHRSFQKSVNFSLRVELVSELVLKFEKG